MVQNGSHRLGFSKGVRYRLGKVLLVAANGFVATTALAQEENDDSQSFPDTFTEQVVEGAELTGELGIFDFRRFHDTNRPFPNIDDPEDDFNTRGTAFGGSVGVRTGALYGWSGNVGISFAEPIIRYESPNENLVGPDNGLFSITQAYLQYSRPGLQLRAGRQLLNTPFANTDQFAFIPRSFNGYSAAVRPLEWQSTGSDHQAPTDYAHDQLMPFEFDAEPNAEPSTEGSATENRVPIWQVFIARMTRYQSRFDDAFTTANRYVEDTSGLFTLGTSLRHTTEYGSYIAQLWHYTFFDTASMQYAELGYQSPAVMASAHSDGLKPYIRAQYAREEETGRAALGEIDATIYGLKVGVQAERFSVELVGHYSPLREGSFRDGQLVHPYSDLSGVFYTDTMNNGVDGLGPGYGLGGRIDIAISDHVEMFTRYVHYEAKRGQTHAFYIFDGERGYAAGIPIIENQNSWGWDVSLRVDLGVFSHHLDGFIIENVLGITDFDGADRFYNNRLRFLYEF